MTDLPDWPPPVCEPCKWLFCDRCQADSWCEHDCDWIYEGAS